MLAHLALLAAQVTNPMLDAYDQITPQVAAERIARCDAGSVEVKSDKVLDTEILVVVVKRAITDEEIACIAKAASFYDVELPPDAQPRFDAIRTARSEVIFKAEGTKWLAAHNLLGALPEYEAGVTDDGEFARKIEVICQADGALSSPYGSNTLDPEWGIKHLGPPTEDGPFACVLNAAWASGFKLSFIGNEQSPR